MLQNRLFEGIKYAVKGNRVGDISHAIGEFVNKNGYSVVREFQGHGIGRKCMKTQVFQTMAKVVEE